jgi:hypothetical protein
MLLEADAQAFRMSSRSCCSIRRPIGNSTISIIHPIEKDWLLVFKFHWRLDAVNGCLFRGFLFQF